MTEPEQENTERGDTVAWRSLWLDGQHALEAAGLESPEVDARRIIEEASGFEGGSFLLGLSEPATVGGVARAEQMLRRRLAGEPLQYVLGSWGFRQLDLHVDRRVLIPRPETETVVERALAELDRIAPPPGRPRVVDLGTGSGAIALSVALERAGAEVFATDVSPDALAVARANLAGIGRAGTRVRLLEGSWFGALPDELRGTIDLLVSNPPYVAESDELPDQVAMREPRGALISGPTGREALEHVLVAGLDWLRAGGVAVVELAPHQAEPVTAFARVLSGYREVVAAPDLTGRMRMVIARR